MPLLSSLMNMSDTPTGFFRHGREQSLRPCRFLISAILLLLACGAPAIAQKPDPRHSLLWRISGNGLERPSYLYGTMHVTDERAFDFSDSVLLKLQECETFAMEILLDSAARVLFREIHSVDSTAPDIRDWLDDDQEEKLDRQLRQSIGLGLESLAHVRPWLLGQFLGELPVEGADSESSGLESDVAPDRPVSLDPYLYRLARGEGKQIVALE